MQETQPLKQRISVDRCNLKWAQNLVTEKHYLQKPVDRRALLSAYQISLDENPIEYIIMAIPHWDRQKGLFTRQDDWVVGQKDLPAA